MQGCYDPLRRLLDAIGFDPSADQLWLTGDLVNRGPDSLQVMRFAIGLGEALHTVLGNHDLHMLAASSGARRPRRGDTFTDVLDAPDAAEMLAWLAARPLLHRDLGFAMVHAGLPPQWSVGEAAERAAELETVLDSPDRDDFLAQMYGDQPDRWEASLHGAERLRFITNALTRTRYVSGDGRLDFTDAGPPGSQPAGLVPWFEAPGRRSRGQPVLFGHWAALRLPVGEAARLGAFHLDTGCVWGGRLTALDLTTLEYTSVECAKGRGS